MDKKELLDKFSSVFSEAKNSGDKEDIEISLSMFKKAVSLLVDSNFRGAKELVECYEGTLNYYNFLTEMEAEEVSSQIVNEDGSKGPRWKNPEEVFQKIKSMDAKCDMAPYYNKWAMYVTMNRISSYMHSVLLKWVGDNKDKYFEACYEMAVSQLKDKGCPYWIRPHYKLSDFEN